MKKFRGFTLAELLIVLGITGIIATLLIGATKNLMPDKTKIMYLKVFDEMSLNIKTLVNNLSIFPAAYQYNAKEIDVHSIPLLNNSQPLNPPFNIDSKYSGDIKLCNILAYTMHAEENANCSATSYPNTPSFITKNGIRFWIKEVNRNIDTTELITSYQTDIYVDVDGSKHSSNCLFGECKNPDTFKFLLAANGELIPADPLGRKYIETRKNWLKKKYKIDGEILASLEPNQLNNKYTNYKTTIQDNNKEDYVQDKETPSSEDDSPNYYNCGEHYLKGKLFVCWGLDYEGNSIVLRANKPARFNIYAFHDMYLPNSGVTELPYGDRSKVDDLIVAKRLCILPIGQTILTCKDEHVLYRDGFNLASSGYKFEDLVVDERYVSLSGWLIEGEDSVFGYVMNYAYSSGTAQNDQWPFFDKVTTSGGWPYDQFEQTRKDVKERFYFHSKNFSPSRIEEFLKIVDQDI